MMSMHGGLGAPQTPAALVLAAAAAAAGGGGTGALALWAMQAAAYPVARATATQVAYRAAEGVRALDLGHSPGSWSAFAAGCAVATLLCTATLGACCVCGGAAATQTAAHAVRPRWADMFAEEEDGEGEGDSDLRGLLRLDGWVKET